MPHKIRKEKMSLILQVNKDLANQLYLHSTAMVTKQDRYILKLAQYYNTAQLLQEEEFTTLTPLALNKIRTIATFFLKISNDQDIIQESIDHNDDLYQNIISDWDTIGDRYDNSSPLKECIYTDLQNAIKCIPNALLQDMLSQELWQTEQNLKISALPE